MRSTAIPCRPYVYCEAWFLSRLNATEVTSAVGPASGLLSSVRRLTAGR